MKRIVNVIVTLILIASFVVSLYAVISSNQPRNIAASALHGALDDLSERDDIEPFVKMLKKGSLEINASSDNTELGGKVYFSKNDLYVEDFHYTDEDLSVSAEAVYLGQKYGYITSEELFGGTYGTLKGKMAEAFGESAFKSFLKSEFGISDDVTYEKIETLLEEYDEGLARDFKKDVKKYYKKYSKVLMRAVQRYAYYCVETEEVKVGEEYKKARVVTVTVDEDDLINISKYLYRRAKYDPALQSAFVKYAQHIIPLCSEKYADLDKKGAKELYKTSINNFGESLRESSQKILPDFRFETELVVAQSSSRLMKITFSVKTEEKDLVDLLSVDFGEDGAKKTDTIGISFYNGNCALEYNIEENSLSKYESKITAYTLESVNEHGVKKMKSSELLRASIDKRTDEILITLSKNGENGEKVSLSGNFNSGGGKLTFEFDTLETALGDDIKKEDVKIRIVADEKDASPKKVKKKNVNSVFELDEKEIKTAYGRFDKLFEKFEIFTEKTLPSRLSEIDFFAELEKARAEAGIFPK